ncbi:hypothetical protein, partial [Spirillospora sp. NPDC048819]|uniref:hypothetical protein n=1 Tax=Spirillospora sp. NPDC048819 TaxID=3155268 RepID=UPI0033DBD83D
VRAPGPHEHGGGAATGSNGLVGVLLVIAVVLVLGIAACVLLRRRGAPGGRLPAVTRVLVAGLAGVTLTVWLTSGARSLPLAAEEPPEPGVPLLRSLALPGDRHLSVLVVPNRPGYNLVGIAGAAQASAGIDRGRLKRGSRRPGSALTWVGVELPAGSSRLWVSAAQGTGSLPVDTGEGPPASPAALRGGDGPECAAAAAGAIVAGGSRPLTGCPADALAPRDAASLRSVVRFIAGRGERTLMLAGDDSPRGRAAAATVRAAAREEGVAVTPPAGTGHPLMVVAGWKRAQALVDDVAHGRLKAQGTYLAPWLMTRPLLSPNARQLIPLRYAPRTAAPMAYVAALNERIPGEYPSTAGYSAWRDVRDRTGPGAVRLYAVALTYIPGQNFGPTAGDEAGGHSHGPDAVGWVPGAMIAEVARPLTGGGPA